MQNYGDFSSMIVLYNFIVAILIMLASPQLAKFAGHLSRTHAVRLRRYTQVASFTFGAVVAALSGTIYVAFHLLKIGV